MKQPFPMSRLITYLSSLLYAVIERKYFTAERPHETLAQADLWISASLAT